MCVYKPMVALVLRMNMMLSASLEKHGYIKWHPFQQT